MMHLEKSVIADRPLLSLAGLTLPALPPSLLVSAAADAGFEAVGVNLNQLWRTVSADPRWFAAEIDALGNALARHGLKLMHGGHLLLGALDKSSATYVIDAMQQLEAMHVVLVAGPQAVGIDIDADFSFVLDHVADIPLLVEFAPYTGWRDLRSAMTFIDRHVDVELRLVVDVLHLIRSSSLPLWMSSDDWPVGLIQICDAPLRSPHPDALQMEARGSRLDVGEGALPLEDIFSKLARNIPIEVEAPCLALRNLTPQARAERSFRHLELFLQSQGYATQFLPS